MNAFFTTNQCTREKLSGTDFGPQHGYTSITVSMMSYLFITFFEKYLVENIQRKFQKDPSTSQLLFLSNQRNFQLWKNREGLIIRDSACQFNIGKTLERQLCKLIS